MSRSSGPARTVQGRVKPNPVSENGNSNTNANAFMSQSGTREAGTAADAFGFYATANSTTSIIGQITNASLAQSTTFTVPDPGAATANFLLDAGLAANTATAASGAATLNTTAGKITSESLTTAAASVYTLTLTNSVIKATSILLVNVGQGSNTTAGLVVQECTPAAGSATIKILNDNGSSALNGTIKISFLVLN